MADYETTAKQIGRRNWRSVFRFDIFLFVFLLVGWSLIFSSASLGLQIYQESWLGVGLVSQVSVDYSRKASTPVAPIKQQVVEAVARDEIHIATPTPLALASPTTTATPEPTLSVVAALGALEVSLGGPYSGDEGSEIPLAAEITVSALNPASWVVSYAWDTDNDGEYDDAEGPSTSVVFYDEGEYLVRVRATNLLDQIALAAATVLVSNAPPLITLEQNILAEEGQPVTLAATASDPGHDVLLSEWDFGDGSPKVTDTLNPRHTFLDNGDYTVSLTVRDTDGGVTTETLLAEVANLPPEVDAGPNQTTNEGDTVTFTGTATDPAGAVDTLTYAWDFSYNGRTFTPEATGPTASKIYPNGPLNVVAALRVRDKDGGETIDTVKVTVSNVAPVITGVSNDGPVGEGSSLALTVMATDVGNDPLSLAVDWDDDGSFDEVGEVGTVSNIWYNQGDYTVRIRVDDGDGGQAFASTTVSTLNEPPVAVASADSGVLEGSPVSFDASDSSDPGLDDALTYAWSFGDGQSGGGESTSHTYDDNDVYSATLTVTDDSGDSSTAGVEVVILNANPTAEAGADLTVDEGANVSVAYSGTATDPGAADTLTYQWDFDNSGDFADASGASGTYVYSSLDGPAEYTVAFRVRDKDYPFPTDGGGEIGEALDTFKLTVKNVLPFNVNAGGPYTCVENENIDLSATAEDAPADVPTLQYAWDLDSGPDFETPGQQPSYQCRRVGTQTVRLRVKDKDSRSDAEAGFASAQIIVSNAPPIAEANGPYTSTVNIPVILDATGSDDPSPDPDALTYHWNFGDGITMTTTSITVTHTYLDDGVYTATLRVEDLPGDSSTDRARVIIINQPPQPTINSIVPNPQTEGNPVTLTGNGGDPDDPSGLTYYWDFGDGQNASGTDLNQVQHTYPEPGVYQVILTVTDDNGAFQSSPAVDVTISNLAPTAIIVGPGQVNEGDTMTFDGSGSYDESGGQLAYAWDLDNDGQFDDAFTVTADFSRNEPATNLTISLRVTDAQGSTDIASTQINVNNLPPTADAGPNQTINEGDTTSFNGSGSNDPGGGNLTYEWDFDYDGVTFTVDGNGPNPTTPTPYPDGPNTVVVALRVYDNTGDVSAIDTLQVTVNNKRPQNVNPGGPYSTTVSAPVNLSGSATDVPADTPLTYTWYLDDNGTLVEILNQQNGSVSWPTAGSYNIILEVKDKDGEIDSAQTTLDVFP